MTAQQYITTKLEETKRPIGLIPLSSSELIDALYATLTTKKFRKFSMSDELKEHIQKSIELNVSNNNPINITFLHGAYKLCRLDESPEVDWAELFALMRYINWLKPICEMYKPGVVLDFYVDDYIIPMLNNIDYKDIETYLESYQHLFNFLNDYRPNNLRMTISPVASFFVSKDAFEESIYKNLRKIEEDLDGKLPELNEQIEAMIILNAKPTQEQLADPHWMQKVWNLHNAYSITKAEPGYHKNRPEKILAFTTSLPMAIGVGSTNRASMKFWIGAGVLRRDGDDFDQDILSPNQLENINFRFTDIDIISLEGKNFKKIRIIE